MTAVLHSESADGASSGPSVNGTTIPASTQIVDSSGNVWTSSNGVYKNGTVVTRTAVTLLMYANNTVYQEDMAGIWWSWNGTTWALGSNPTSVASPSGTSIPTSTQIIDGNGNIWAVSGGVYKNGSLVDQTAITQLLYINGGMFLQDSAGIWWSWNGRAWLASGDPTGGSTGAAILSWTPPTQNTDQSPLTNLAGYTIYYGSGPTALTQMIQLGNPAATGYTINNLGAGTYYFAVAAYSSLGWEGPNSAVVSKTITAANSD